MRLTLNTIKEKLIRSNISTLPDNLIAVAIRIDERELADHAALLIGVNRQYYIFHFMEDGIKNDDLARVDTNAQWIYHKQLEVIDSMESETFLSHCERILNNCNPKYGFLFDGSYYKDGVHFSESGLPEYSTCVGFCINVISGYLYDHDKYFEVTDWDLIPVDHPSFEKYYNAALETNPEMDVNMYKSHHRRIKPSEYVAGAFMDHRGIPIRKTVIDLVISNIEAVISNKRASDRAAS